MTFAKIPQPILDAIQSLDEIGGVESVAQYIDIQRAIAAECESRAVTAEANHFAQGGAFACDMPKLNDNRHMDDPTHFDGYPLGKMPRGLAVALTDAGFSIYETGGGCTAWQAKIGQFGANILVTDDASHILDRDECDIGIYDNDGECLVCVSAKVAQWGIPKLLRDVIVDMPFSSALPDDVLDLPADSVVGQSCIKLCESASETITRDYGDGALEFDVSESITAAVVTQCTVWLHG